jgi:hypothetical protein
MMERVVVFGSAPIARLGAADLLLQAGIPCGRGADLRGVAAVVVQLDDPGLRRRLSDVRRASPGAAVVAVGVDRPVLRVARRPTWWAVCAARDQPLTAAAFVDAVAAALSGF